jgi:hypothetical protein
MPLSKEALGTLLTARTAFIEQADYSIPDWVNVVDLQTAEGTEERAAWSAHITAVTDAIEGKKTIPEVRADAPSAIKLLNQSPAAWCCSGDGRPQT